MTRVRWTIDAANDFASIVKRVREDNPEAARRVTQTIYEGAVSLRSLPNRGRPGLAENTHELIIAPWPYIAVYEVIESQDEVQVLRIRHTSKNWP